MEKSKIIRKDKVINLPKTSGVYLFYELNPKPYPLNPKPEPLNPKPSLRTLFRAKGALALIRPILATRRSARHLGQASATWEWTWPQ